MQVRAFVDWLGCTIPALDDNIGVASAMVLQMIPNLSGRFTYAKPLHGYKNAARTLEGVVVSTGRLDMGTHVELPGSALAALAKCDGDIVGLVGSFVRQGANFSRADFAVDAIDSGLSIHRLRTLFEDGRADTKARYFKLMESSGGGVTLYIGAPQSDRQLRVYNKAAERAAMDAPVDAKDWIRIELQMRNETANTAAHMLTGIEDVATTVRSVILSAVDFPTDKAWVKIMRGPVAEMGSSTHRRGNVRKWLLGPCATSLARELQLDPAFKLEFERAVQSAALVIQDKADSGLDKL